MISLKELLEEEFPILRTLDKLKGNAIPFKNNDPTTFDTYVGQNRVKERFQVKLGALAKDEGIRILLTGPAGLGKTSFIRVLANEMRARGQVKNYIELVGGTIETRDQLNEFIVRLEPRTFIFIDEIHSLSPLIRDSLLPVIQDGVHSLSSTRMHKLPGSISWAGATTDLGRVHAALQRRLLVVTLDPVSLAERIALVRGLKFAITDEAAELMAKRSWTPWELKDELFATSRDVAIVDNKKIIDKPHVDRACELLGIDSFGLRPKDRTVLVALFNSRKTVSGVDRYALSARALIASTGVDASSYYDSIEPKLLRLGYITVATGIGRELTEKAIGDYFLQ